MQNTHGLRRGASVVLSLVALIALPAPATAQHGASIPARNVKWYEAVGAFGGIALISALDQEVRSSVQSDRSGGKDDVSRVLRRMGEPEVFATAGLGVLGVGLISGDRGIRESGIRIVSALGVAGVVASGVKLVVGRQRPDVSSRDQYGFKPFAGGSHLAFVSGHTTMAFALAASVADEVHSAPVTVALYALAAGTAWSRVNDDRHWLSDVVGGALVGIASAKFASGRWTILGARAPGFMIGPRGASIGYGMQF
ncbi:MAG: phosphatase PAP2 family protein [Gemmatimonadota bacterium]